MFEDRWHFKSSFLRTSKAIELKEIPIICLDCRFLTQHSLRGLNLTFLQLNHLLSKNRYRKNPWPIYFVNYEIENPNLIRMEQKWVYFSIHS